MSDVFLSYASEDQQRIGPLVRALGAAGLEVFWDRSIGAGEAWRTVLEAEIGRCGCVLAIWSGHSLRSRWVLEEADEGQRAGKLLCALIDDVRPPMGFRGEQAVDLRGWDGASHSPPFATLLAAVRKRLRRPAQPPAGKKPAATQPILEDLLKHGFQQMPGPPGLAFVVHKATMGGLVSRVVAARSRWAGATQILRLRGTAMPFSRTGPRVCSATMVWGFWFLWRAAPARHSLTAFSPSDPGSSVEAGSRPMCTTSTSGNTDAPSRCWAQCRRRTRSSGDAAVTGLAVGSWMMDGRHRWAALCAPRSC